MARPKKKNVAAEPARQGPTVKSAAESKERLNTMSALVGFEREVDALVTCHKILSALKPIEQRRVLDFLESKLFPKAEQ